MSTGQQGLSNIFSPITDPPPTLYPWSPFVVLTKDSKSELYMNSSKAQTDKPSEVEEQESSRHVDSTIFLQYYANTCYSVLFFRLIV